MSREKTHPEHKDSVTFFMEVGTKNKMNKIGS